MDRDAPYALRKYKKANPKYDPYVLATKSVVKTYCVCNKPDDYSRYIQCSLCASWLHVRCSGIQFVLPGFTKRKIPSTNITLHCGQLKCRSAGEPQAFFQRKHHRLQYTLDVKPRSLMGEDLNSDSGVSLQNIPGKLITFKCLYLSS